MKRSYITVIAVAVVAILGIGSALVFAQSSEPGKRGGKRPHFGGKGGPEGRGGFGPIFRGLDLTDEQKAKLKELHEANKAAVEPIHEALKGVHEKMKAATENGSFDEAVVTAIANEKAGYDVQLTVERARFMSQAFALLTDEQKAKLAEFKEKRPEPGKGFRGPRQGPPPAENN